MLLFQVLLWLFVLSGGNSFNNIVVPGFALVGKSGVKSLNNLVVPGLALVAKS